MQPDRENHQLALVHNRPEQTYCPVALSQRSRDPGRHVRGRMISLVLRREWRREELHDTLGFRTIVPVGRQQSGD